jgi:hypothetical protein
MSIEENQDNIFHLVKGLSYIFVLRIFTRPWALFSPRFISFALLKMRSLEALLDTLFLLRRGFGKDFS